MRQLALAADAVIVEDGVGVQLVDLVDCESRDVAL